MNFSPNKRKLSTTQKTNNKQYKIISRESAHFLRISTSFTGVNEPEKVTTAPAVLKNRPHLRNERGLSGATTARTIRQPNSRARSRENGPVNAPQPRLNCEEEVQHTDGTSLVLGRKR